MTGGCEVSKVFRWCKREKERLTSVDKNESTSETNVSHSAFKLRPKVKEVFSNARESIERSKSKLTALEEGGGVEKDV
jgi:hypothetical protein